MSKSEARSSDPTGVQGESRASMWVSERPRRGCRLLSALLAGVLRSDEPKRPKGVFGEQRRQHPAVPSATPGPSMPAGGQADRRVTWSHCYFVPPLRLSFFLPPSALGGNSETCDGNSDTDTGGRRSWSIAGICSANPGATPKVGVPAGCPGIEDNGQTANPRTPSFVPGTAAGTAGNAWGGSRQ